jgi:hypothetical protein
VPERLEEVFVPVHFVLPNTDEEWFIATYFDLRAKFSLIGLWKATVPQFGGGVYEQGSVELWQLLLPREVASVVLDTAWIPTCIATIERQLRQQGYIPRLEATRLY